MIRMPSKTNAQAMHQADLWAVLQAIADDQREIIAGHKSGALSAAKGAERAKLKKAEEMAQLHGLSVPVSFANVGTLDEVMPNGMKLGDMTGNEVMRYGRAAERIALQRVWDARKAIEYSKFF